MTVFGIIWITIVGYCFIQKDIKYMAFITLFFMTFQCVNVINFGAFVVGPQILTSLLFIVKSLIYKGFVIKLDKNNIFENILWVVLLGVVVYSSIYNGVLETNWLRVLQLFIYIFAFKYFALIKDDLSFDFIYNSIRSINIFLIIIGVLQVLTTMNILPLRSILEIFVYNDFGSDVIFHKWASYSRIMSTFMEPSYYAGILVGSFYYLLSFTNKWKENALLLIMIFVFMLLTFSSTAYVAFVIIGGVFMLFQKNIPIQWKVLGILISVFGFLFMYFGFYDLLDAVIFSKAETGSGVTRQRWNNEAWSAFLSSSLIGIGYKNTRGSSLFYSLLGQIGLVGSISFALIMLKYFVNMIKSKMSNLGLEKYKNETASTIALFSIFVCQLVAVPDLDLCTFWFWMYAFGMIINKKIIDR